VVRDCDGRVFSIGNLPDMLTVAPLPSLIGLALAHLTSESSEGFGIVIVIAAIGGREHPPGAVLRDEQQRYGRWVFVAIEPVAEAVHLGVAALRLGMASAGCAAAHHDQAGEAVVAPDAPSAPALNAAVGRVDDRSAARDTGVIVALVDTEPRRV